MSQSLIVGSANASFQVPDNSTRKLNIAGALNNLSVEASVELPVRAPGTFSNLFIRSSGNTVAVASTVFTLIKSGVATSLTVAFGASESGVKTDITNAPSFADTDMVCLEVVVPNDAGGARFFNINVIGVTFTPDDTANCWSWLSWEQIVSVATASTSWFFGPSGSHSSANTTEAAVAFTMRSSFTSSNLSVYLSSNARTTDSTYRTRKNGADGNQVVVFASGESGYKEDITNTDSLVDGDTYNTSLTTGTGTGAIVTVHVSTLLKSTAGEFQMISGWAGGASFSPSLTRNIAINNSKGGVATGETNVMVYSLFDFTIKLFSGYVSANTLSTSNLTARLRDNVANGNEVLTWAAAETGHKVDLSNQDTITAVTDDINYQFITAAGGSGNATPNYFGCIGFTVVPGGAATWPGWIGKVGWF